MLIDSNIIIYAARPEHTRLRQFIAEHNPFVSAVSYVEVLLEAFFAIAPMLDLAQPVLDQAVKLRQLRKMTLGDALIAGTALTHHLTLVTRNSTDFTWIAGLTILNPFELS